MNYQWLDLAFSLSNKFDFDSFKEEMKAAGLNHELQESDYFQRIGMIQGEMTKYEISHQEAYANIISRMNTTANNQKVNAEPNKTEEQPCNGCGGKANIW